MISKLNTIWRLMRGERLRFGRALLALAFSAAFLFLVPLVIRATIDHVIAGKALEGPSILMEAIRWMGGRSVLVQNLWLAGSSVLVLMSLSGLCMYLKGRWASEASLEIVRKLKNRLYDQIQHLPSLFLDSAETGDLVQRCTSDVETFRNFLNEEIVEIGRTVFMVTISVGIMLALDVRMTLLAVCTLPVLFTASLWFFVRVKSAFQRVDEAEGALTTVIQENLTGIRVVRSFGRQDFEIDKFGKRNEAFRRLRIRLIEQLGLFWSTTDLICLSQMGIVLIVGGYWASAGLLTVGTLYAFFQYVLHYLWPVRQSGRLLSNMGQAMVALGRMELILDTERESAPSTGKGALPQRVRGEIEVDDLTFSFPGTDPVLDGISFQVRPGETVALLGPSGSGKSTLIHLLLRMYDYEKGSIRIDGRELNGIDRKKIREQVSVVMQEPFLYSRSIRENIRLGRAEASDAEMVAATSTACIHEAIEEFQGGYDTVIGERGVTLSGGQRQRVALAMALLADRPILVLDDALSAVDTGTETRILDALRQRRGRQTTLLVAHRLSTLQEADRILVFDGGRIVQRGTPEELLKEEGIYRNLWKIQNAWESELVTERE